VSLLWTVSNDRCVEVCRTPCVGSPTSFRSDIWQTVVPKKAAVVADKSTIYLELNTDKNCILINLYNLLVIVSVYEFIVASIPPNLE